MKEFNEMQIYDISAISESFGLVPVTSIGRSELSMGIECNFKATQSFRQVPRNGAAQ